MTFGSCFAGVGGFDIGFERAGLTCRWQVEIDPQASSVLARHWPDVKRFGDICAVRKKDLEPVDVVIGGWPCQDHSIAGKREGFRGERSVLFFELVRVVRLVRPRYLVWENVPNLLANDDGRDFAHVLQSLGDIGYFGAWRVLDARFFGVPQRRRRVFGVFGRGCDGAVRCAQILSLTQGVPGHPPPRRQAEEDVAGTVTGGARKRGGYSARNESGLVAVCVTTKGFPDGDGGNAIPARCQTARGDRLDGETDNFVIDLQNCRIQKTHGTICAAADRQNRGHAVCITGGVTHTLTAHGSDASEDGTGRGTPIVVFQQNQRDEVRDLGGVVGAIAAESGMKRQNYLAFCPDEAFTLKTQDRRVGDGWNGNMMASPLGIRRFTPRENERLMSWPDDWTRWDANGAEIADSPRYRMIGNGVVANCAEWIARRLMEFAS